MPSPHYLTVGLVAGAILGAIACIPLRWVTDALRWAPVIAALALRSEGLASERVVAGVAIVAAASLVPVGAIRAAGALAGGWMLLDHVPFVLSSNWTAAVAACGMAAMALVTRTERVTSRPFTSVCLVITLAGIYAGPPDTEVTTIVGAVAGIAAFAVVVLPWQRRRNVPDASTALVALICWTAIVESQGRLAAFPGAIACFGVLLVEPVVRLVTRSRTRPTGTGELVRLGLQLGAVLVASRVASLREDVAGSVAISAATLLCTAIALGIVGRVERRHDARTTRPPHVPSRSVGARTSGMLTRLGR